LSTYQLLLASMEKLGDQADARTVNEIGRFVAHLTTLRRMSTSVAGMLTQGQKPILEAALVKDLGTAFEQEIPRKIANALGSDPLSASNPELLHTLAYLLQLNHVFSLRGGTREILRGMISRGMGLR
jgi:hypothetical protein